MRHFRLEPRESDDDLRGVLHELVRRAGQREAFMAMDCPRLGTGRICGAHPANAHVWLMPREMIRRGAHVIVVTTPRIPEVCVNPLTTNVHWADMTQALLDPDGNVTEGLGF